MQRTLHSLAITGIRMLATLALKAQQAAPVCGWNTAIQKIYLRNPAMRVNMQATETKLQRQMQILDADSLYTIPIVVHVIHTGTPVGSADNPTDANIMAMISSLNDSWRKNGAQYGGVDMKIQFQLAVRSPLCGTTTGIERINGSGVPNYVSGGIAIGTFGGSADELAVKGLADWPNTDYINIWIVNKINGSAVNTGGFAYFAENN